MRANQKPNGAINLHPDEPDQPSADVEITHSSTHRYQQEIMRICTSGCAQASSVDPLNSSIASRLLTGN